MTELKTSHKIAIGILLVALMIVGVYFIVSGLIYNQPNNNSQPPAQLVVILTTSTTPQLANSTSSSVAASTQSEQTIVPKELEGKTRLVTTQEHLPFGRSAAPSTTTTTTTIITETNNIANSVEPASTTTTTTGVTNLTPAQVAQGSSGNTGAGGSGETTLVASTQPQTTTTQSLESTTSTETRESTTQQQQQQETTSNVATSGIPMITTTTTTTQQQQQPPEDELAWLEFRRQFNKNYPTLEEEINRRVIFSANKRFIDEFNNLRQDNVLFRLGINQFADMTRDEINGRMIGQQTSWQEAIGNLSTPIPPPMNMLSEGTSSSSSSSSSSSQQQQQSVSVDWRNVTAGMVVDQVNCVESAVFAAVASIEAAYNMAMLTENPNALPLKLSESQVLSCLSKAHPNICHGEAQMAKVFSALQHFIPNGLSSAQAVQQGRLMEGTCELPPGDLPRVKLNAYSLVNQDNIPDAILMSGPLAIALDASQSTFHFYQSGLYHELNCSQDYYNLHALLVGYSSSGGPTTLDAPGYYLVRNSFGEKWGELGHIKLLKDEQRNKCLPQRFAIYPNL